MKKEHGKLQFQEGDGSSAQRSSNKAGSTSQKGILKTKEQKSKPENDNEEDAGSYDLEVDDANEEESKIEGSELEKDSAQNG